MWVKDFVIYLDDICNIFTLIPSGPVAFPTDIDDNLLLNILLCNIGQCTFYVKRINTS